MVRTPVRMILLAVCFPFLALFFVTCSFFSEETLWRARGRVLTRTQETTWRSRCHCHVAYAEANPLAITEIDTLRGRNVVQLSRTDVCTSLTKEAARQTRDERGNVPSAFLCILSRFSYRVYFAYYGKEERECLNTKRTSSFASCFSFWRQS